MTDTLIDAAIAASSSKGEVLSTVASQVRPGTWTLTETVAKGRMLGERFAELGLAPGDIVGIMLPNWHEWLVAFVACGQAGCVALPLVGNFGPGDLGFILRQSRTRLLVTPESWRGTDYAALVAACGELPDLAHHLIADEALLAGPLETDLPAPRRRLPDDLALLLYTSGTTARPKGVRHTSRTILAELAAQAEARGSIEAEVLLSPWPPGHMAGALAMIRHLIGGVPLVAMDEWDAAGAAVLIESHKVTSSSGTPFHLGGLIDAADRAGSDLSSLRHYIVGAAPVPQALVERCTAAGLSVYRCYGSTEHPTISSGVADDPLEKRLGTEGRIMAGSEVRFVDEAGCDVATGAEGEIATRGRELFVGYLDAALDDDAFLPGGWYRTGDIGRLDADGYLLIADRKKDIIIRGGENISSKEVEDILLAMDGVAEVAVVAAPDARMGEIVRACIVARPGAEPTIDSIREHFRNSGIARHKTPEKLSLMSELPRNATGKILKHLLRAARN